MFSFVESPKLFTRLVGDYLTDDDILPAPGGAGQSPERGAVVAGSGGVRKLRWAQPGRGKRGGIRVIYYTKTRDGVIWMLTIYAKNEAENIPADVLRKIKEELDG